MRRSGLQKTEGDAVKAANLMRECESMETEIAMLKNKRSAAEVSLPASVGLYCH